MQRPDEIHITFDQNPAMGEAVRDAKVGDEFKAELRATIKAVTPEGVDLIVEAIVPDGFEIDEETNGSNDGAVPSDALMTTAAAMVRRKSTT